MAKYRKKPIVIEAVQFDPQDHAKMACMRYSLVSSGVSATRYELGLYRHVGR